MRTGLTVERKMRKNSLSAHAELCKTNVIFVDACISTRLQQSLEHEPSWKPPCDFTDLIADILSSQLM